MTYTLQVSREQVIVFYAFSIIFIIIALLGYQEAPIAGALVLGLGLWNALYATSKAQSWLKFQPEEPTIILKNGFGKVINLQPSDCVKVGTNQGRVTSPKLTYRTNGQTRSMVLYSSDYEAIKAWQIYSGKWLESVKIDKVKRDDTEFEHILQSPTEDYYNEHFGKK